MKILYVEDNQVDIDLTVRRLGKVSPAIHIDTAHSQTEALQFIRREDFSEYDLVLTDMHLQDGDGIAILSHIRGHSLPVAVVILTGQGDEEAAVAALKAGADDYIVKKQGYLEKLPEFLENASTSFRKAKDYDVGRLKVIYVEHNQADVDLTCRHIARYTPHIQMDPVYSVEDFYKIFEQTGDLDPYNVILLDYRLPQANALEILKEIKLSTNNTIPVILITGKGDEEIAVKALKMGAFDYLTKNQGYLFKLPSVIENAHYSMRLMREHNALIESEKRYRILFENSPIVKLVIDPENGRIVNANAAAVRFYGWSFEQLITKKMSEINTTPEEELRVIRGRVAKTHFDHYQFQHRLANGSIRDVEVNSGPIEIDGKTMLYSVVYDITERIRGEKERERLQRKLVQAQKMEAFGQLAGGIAHDFNNILSAVLGFSELALSQIDEKTPLWDDINEIYIAGRRAKELVSQILTFARQADEEIQPVRINQIAKEVLKLIRSSTSTSIEIRQNVDSTALVKGNAVQIHQVMMNLCTNATYAMEDGGVLEIIIRDVVLDGKENTIGTQHVSGAYVEMIVSDTGSGIPQDIIDSIFEPYFTTKPPGEGTGMGLSMVHGIVQSYGGAIQVASSPGKGTVFTIYLPITSEDEKSLHYESNVLPRGTERILLVDDESSVARAEGKILERLGYRVTVMNDSVESLKLFAARPYDFDLVLTDTNMPKMPGNILAVELMKIRKDMPVILATGYSRKMSHETIKAIGVKALIHKPIVAKSIATILRDVLDQA